MTSLLRSVKIKSLELVSDISLSTHDRPQKLFTSICPYCNKPFSNRVMKTHLKQVHGKSFSAAIKFVNQIEPESDLCNVCEKNPRLIEVHDALNPLLRPYCKTCAMSYGKKLQTETLVNTINEETGKTLMRMRMDKQFSTMKNTIDPKTGKDSFEIYLERVERSSRSQSKRFRSTDLFYRSKNELEFFNRYYELLNLKPAPTIKNYHKSHYYVPDAYIPSTNTLVEIKSKGVMLVRQSPQEVYLKFKKSLELGYKILFVLDYKEIRFNNINELDKYFSQYNIV